MPGSQAAAQQQSGRIEKPSPIHLSNLMVVCPTCNTPTRVARANKAGKRGRWCHKCDASLERSA
jgi:large subunit ribosomal protein L24